MSTKSKFNEQNLGFFDNKYNPAFNGGVWATCPRLAAICDPSLAHVISEDFNNIDAATLAGYTVTQATTGTFTLDDAAGGVALVDSGSTTATQGANVQKLGECVLPAADKDIWFEARIKVVDTFDKAELFIGLAETDTSIIATSAVNVDYFTGWHCVTDDGVLLFDSSDDSTVDGLASTTLAEDTWVKLGFHIKGLTSIDHYVNDVKQATSHVTANIPTQLLTPSFVCQSGGTNDPILHIDKYDVFQIR